MPGFDGMTAHTKFMTPGFEAWVSFFDNVDVASVLDEIYFVEMCREAKVGPQGRACIVVFYRFMSRM